MKRRLDTADANQDGPLPRFFAAFFGAFLGLSLVKFGNPPIFERAVTAPTNAYEFILGSPWPIVWAYVLFAFVGFTGIFVAKPKLSAPSWFVALPLAWLIWQCIAAFFTVNPDLTKPTLAHFVPCVGCFYLGCFALASLRRLDWFWPGLVFGLLIVIAIGWEQHFGGLEQTRKYFFMYIYPRLKEVPPEYLKKINSTRIFSTLFYPNALAGVMLLLLPAILEVIWQCRQRFTFGARLFLLSVVAVGGLGCLYWSGSKGGWLLMLILGLIWMLRLPFSPSLKRGLVLTVFLAGLAGFFWRYSGFFQKGATSVGARFDYWQAAAKTIVSNPFCGSGPGTFSVAYQKVKRPESEMSRLVHNDYLEQGSDSGVPGLILYTAFLIGVLVVTRPAGCFAPGANVPWRDWLKGRTGFKPPVGAAIESTNRMPKADFESLRFVLWLGLLGWAMQSFFEFGLYIPGLAWPAFAIMGLLLGRKTTDEH